MREKMEELFQKHGFEDFHLIDPVEIVVAQWVRMKCMFGCGDYGKNACCPPNVPSVAECERFFKEYKTAAIFRFEKQVEKPEDRHEWTKQVNAGLLQLERAVFLAGYEKVFLLFMDGCSFCAECVKVRESCKNPRQARPTGEALAIDVYTTVRKIGYPIQVCADYSHPMNRYAFLLIE